MAGATLASRPIAILSMIVLARLLDPADFGLIALASVLFGTAQLFSGLGMAQALIQSQRDVRLVAFQAFFITCLSGLFLFLLLNWRIDFFATLLGNRELAPILRWMSLLLLFNTLALVPEAILRRDLQFGRVSVAMIVNNGMTNLVAIILAFLGFGLWSLVWGQLSGALARMLLLWFSTDGWYWLRPQRLNRTILGEIIPYGLKATSGGLVNFVNSNWDDWYVGRILGAAALGFYDKAYNLTNGTIAGLNTSILNGVFMPSYARIQNDPARLKRAYLKGLGLSAMLMAPLSMGVFAVAPEMVIVLFGDKWVPMIPTLQVFAFMALARPLAASTSPLFRAIGKPELDLQGGIVVLVTMIPMILYMIGWGIEGVATAVVLSFVFGLLFNIYKLNSLLPGVAREMIPAVAPSLVSSALMVGAVMLTRVLLHQSAAGLTQWMVLLILVIVGGVAFAVSGYLMQRTLIHELGTTLVEALPGNRLLARIHRGPAVKA